ncbi:MAG: hypothetical protein ACLFST_13040 [Spirochaetia bacterium]
MKKMILVALVFLAAFSLSADISGVLDEADALRKDGNFSAAESLLESNLSRAASGSEKAEIYWRLARLKLNTGERLADKGGSNSELIDLYLAGQDYAETAMEADPDNHLGYYWSSANIGKYGQVKGVLKSLAKAKPMRELLTTAISLKPDFPDAYFVLGQLYEKLPGGIISFGNDDYAVSLGRRAVDLMEKEVRSGDRERIDYDYYIQLASHLIERGWNEAQRDKYHARKKKRYPSADNELERGFYYEGTVSIPNKEDEEEAEDLLNFVIGKIEAMANPSEDDVMDLKKAKELMETL